MINRQLEFEEGIKNNDANVIKSLLQTKELIKPDNDYNWAIRESAKKGYVDLVKLLLNDNRVNPTEVQNYAIREASQNGHYDIVNLLLSDNRVNPAANNNWAILNAKNRPNNDDVVFLLWSDKRVKNTLKEDDEGLYNKLIIMKIKRNI
jgi:hypothetical protein